MQKEMQSTINRLHLFLVHSLSIFISFLHALKYQVPYIPRAHLPGQEEEVNCFNNRVRHYNCERICCADCYKLFQQQRGVPVK